MTAGPQDWFRRFDRAWFLGRAQWTAWTATFLLSCAASAYLLWSGRQAHVQYVADAQRLEQADSAAALPAVATSPNSTDFTSSLGGPVPAAAIVQELQRASTAAGVGMSSIQAQGRDPSAEQLGRLELTVTLRGPYVGTKQVLKQVIERYPAMTVQRLRMRRAQAPTDVETNVTLSMWSAPAATVSPASGPSSTAGTR